MVQYRGVVGKEVEQFRQKGRQVIIYPENLKSGEVRQPFEKAR
jgi:branched-chain amino acid transport system substrate-binding protein